MHIKTESESICFLYNLTDAIKQLKSLKIKQVCLVLPYDLYVNYDFRDRTILQLKKAKIDVEFVISEYEAVAYYMKKHSRKENCYCYFDFGATNITLATFKFEENVFKLERHEIKGNHILSGNTILQKFFFGENANEFCALSSMLFNDFNSDDNTIQEILQQRNHSEIKEFLDSKIANFFRDKDFVNANIGYTLNDLLTHMSKQVYQFIKENTSFLNNTNICVLSGGFCLFPEFLEMFQEAIKQEADSDMMIENMQDVKLQGGYFYLKDNFDANNFYQVTKLSIGQPECSFSALLHNDISKPKVEYSFILSEQRLKDNVVLKQEDKVIKCKQKYLDLVGTNKPNVMIGNDKYYLFRMGVGYNGCEDMLASIEFNGNSITKVLNCV